MFNNLKRAGILALALTAGIGVLPAAAHAQEWRGDRYHDRDDRRDRDRDRHEWREHERHERRDWDRAYRDRSYLYFNYSPTPGYSYGYSSGYPAYGQRYYSNPNCR